MFTRLLRKSSIFNSDNRELASHSLYLAWVSYNPGHNILELYDILVNSRQVKRNLISSIANLVRELPHELPNDLRLRILGN